LLDSVPFQLIQTKEKAGSFEALLFFFFGEIYPDPFLCKIPFGDAGKEGFLSNK